MSALDVTGKRIVLLLQGGGTLGPYQVGAFRALAEHCAIDWVAGISIGAIHASVIAGHRGPDAAQELENLWGDILSLPYPPADCTEWLEACRPWLGAIAHFPLLPKYAAWAWTAFNLEGQRNFFTPRVLNPLQNPWYLQWVGDLQREQLGFYDTAPLRKTLDRHVDWASLRRPGATRLSLGAARLSDGEIEFFDSAHREIRVEHVLASGALPPAFPPVQIDADGRDSEWYVDGGVSSNTPIEALQEDLVHSDLNTLAFLVDLWDRKSTTKPVTLDDLVWRQKSIQFGSRKKSAESVVQMHEYMALAGQAPATRLEVCQLMLERDTQVCDFAFSDTNFLRSNYERLSQQGHDDMRSALERADLVSPPTWKFAALYRYGSAQKHQATDRKLFLQRATPPVSPRNRPAPGQRGTPRP